MELSILLETEKQFYAKVVAAKKELIQEIAETPIPGVKVLGNNCFQVKLSTIRDNRLIMSPEYYSPTSQADLIRSAINPDDTATKLFEKINKIISEGYIVVSRTKHTLNPQTIQILKRFVENY